MYEKVWCALTQNTRGRPSRGGVRQSIRAGGNVIFMGGTARGGATRGHTAVVCVGADIRVWAMVVVGVRGEFVEGYVVVRSIDV